MQNPILRASCLMALLALIASAAHGVPITVPTGLNLGDEYRLVFVTSTTRDATSHIIADYNDFVTAAANAVPELAALGTTWTAIGSVLGVDARDNTNTNPNVAIGVPIYRLDNTLIASDNADLWDGAILAAISVDETGSLISAPSYVHAGTDGDGVGAENHRLGYNWVHIGNAHATDLYWVSELATETFHDHHLYGISGILTFIPEPGTAVLLAMGLAVLALRRRLSA